MKMVPGALLILLIGPIIGISVLLGASGGAGAAAGVAVCRTAGPMRGLTAVQAANARTIVSAAQQAAIETALQPGTQQRVELIALMTAQTESTLHNYANPKVPASEQLPNDGDPPTGGDHDSVGLFQQRASWGVLSARMTPAVSTKLFVARLLVVPGWQTIPPGAAAQAVQISANPDAYALAQSQAESWLRQIAHSPMAMTCGSDGLPATSPRDVPPGSLPRRYTLPVAVTDAERRAVSFTLAQLGKPYVFGAVGPDSYDCSGLTMAAWAAAGIALPHYTVAQYAMGTPVAAPSLLSPGDLVFIPGSDGSLNPPNPQHVGMYIGDGLITEAPQTGDVVKVVPLHAFGPIVGMRRYG